VRCVPQLPDFQNNPLMTAAYILFLVTTEQYSFQIGTVSNVNCIKKNPISLIHIPPMCGYELTLGMDTRNLPTMPFSSDDLRSHRAYSLPRPSRSRSEQGNCSEPLHESGFGTPMCGRRVSSSSIETSGVSSKLKSIAECVSILRALARRIRQCGVVKPRVVA
jgi:hypothetical protein